jgi:hypothetical protein
LGFIERRLGHELPEAYRNFVRAHDGATPPSNIFDVPGSQSTVRSFIPVAQADAIRQRIEGFPPHGLPIAEDDCGNYVWLDPTSGAIFFWDHEMEGAGERIAEDFDQFVTKLHPFDPASLKLAEGQVKRVWGNPDFKPKFD